MSESHEPTPAWLVERLAAGELPEAKARALRDREELSDQLQEIARSNAALLAQHPPAEVTRELERRLRAGNPRRPSAQHARWLAAAAAVCGATLFLFTRNTADPSGEQVLERGLQPQLAVFRKTANGVERLKDRERVRAGDMLQLAYVSAGRTFGVVASIDGRGTITLHLPERAETAVRLQDNGQSVLPHAFELDDTPGTERFVFVSANQPFPTSVVVDALRTRSPLESHFLLSEIELKKQP